VKYSLFMNVQTPRDGRTMKSFYDDRIAQAVWAEKLGFEAVFLAEHAFVDHGKPSPAVILSNIAARTTTLRLGMAVSVLPWHNPIEIAQDFATVDVLSDGRLDFGVGRGLFKCEFDGYGVPWEEAQGRFDESLDVILKAWTGQPFSYNGKFYKIPEVEISPRPLQRPHPPLWQPTISQGSLTKAVQRGIHPILGASLSPLADIKKQFGRLNEVITASGRKDIRRVGHPYIYVGDTVKKAREEARGAIEWYLKDFAGLFTLLQGETWPEQYAYYEPWSKYIRSLTADFVLENDLTWVGDVQYVTERVRWLRDECNVDYMLSNMGFGGLDHDLVMKSMERLAKKVMPALV
jgi:alkanesulfonate monooxygenase SsuD/methylene tetrahydromethanopterin reductase-like flavin-dependent oxidoreductase (luciferase family)